MKTTFSLPVFELVAKGKFCIANVILLCALSLGFPCMALNHRPQDTDTAQNGGEELLEIVGIDS